MDDFDDDADPKPRPKRSGRGKNGRGKNGKKKNGSSAGKRPLIALGVVFGLGALVGAGIFFSFSDDDKMAEMSAEAAKTQREQQLARLQEAREKLRKAAEQERRNSLTPQPKVVEQKGNLVRNLPTAEEALEKQREVWQRYEHDTLEQQPPIQKGPQAPVAPKQVQPLQKDNTILAALRGRPPAWETYSANVPPSSKPMIAIVMDDMGVDRRRTAIAINKLPKEITFSFLPYANQVADQVKVAQRMGHEIMVHLPTEATNNAINPGKNALFTGMNRAAVERSLIWNLSRFDGYVGLNNHMGSAFTADQAGVDLMMQALQGTGLMFLDSRTTAKTVAEKAARSYGLRSLRRDVFLDYDKRPQTVVQQLRATEKRAKAQGYAIAIGHPRDATIEALSNWVMNLEQRGFALVPITTILQVTGG